MQKQNIIKFDNVTFSYSSGETLFKSLSMGLNGGSFYLLKGYSGSGKSTLFRLMTRLEEPGGGEIFFKEKPLSSYHPPALRRSILYIQQTPLAIDAPVRDNLIFPFSFKNNRHLAPPGDKKLLMFLDDFSLTGVNLDANAKNLSVGQLQRICFIRGLLLSPEIILLDEPTSALDAKSCRLVEDMAVRLCVDQGLTVIMASHKGFESEGIKHTVIKIGDGRVKENSMKEILELDLPEDYFYSKNHEWLAQVEDIVKIGINDYAQDQLGEIVFVELPSVGDHFNKGDEFGTVESVKAVSELYIPVSGEVTAVNRDLEETPELVNSSPCKKGWMIQISPSDPSQLKELFKKDAYIKYLKGMAP